jgi:hypothetical protein
MLKKKNLFLCQTYTGTALPPIIPPPSLNTEQILSLFENHSKAPILWFDFNLYYQKIARRTRRCMTDFQKVWNLLLPWVKYGVRSPKFIWAPCAQLCSLAEAPQPPPPAFGLIYEGAIGQPRYTTSLCDPLLAAVAVSDTKPVVFLCCRLQLLGVVSLWAALSHGINLRKSLKGKNIGLLCTDMCFNCMCIIIEKRIYI